MIREADREIEAWVRGILDEVEVAFSAPTPFEPAPPDRGDRVNVYLMDLAHTPPPTRTRWAPPLKVELRYLITTWSSDERDAHHRLGVLMEAALKSSDYEAEFGAVESSTWQAFGIPPRPAFILRATVAIERPVEWAPLVTEPRIEFSDFDSLSGRVMGPDDTPIANASLRTRTGHYSTTTDERGYFRFPALPGGSGEHELLVAARGKRMSVTAKTGRRKRPLVIRFESLEA